MWTLGKIVIGLRCPRNWRILDAQGTLAAAFIQLQQEEDFPDNCFSKYTRSEIAGDNALHNEEEWFKLQFNTEGIILTSASVRDDYPIERTFKAFDRAVDVAYGVLGADMSMNRLGIIREFMRPLSHADAARMMEAQLPSFPDGTPVQSAYRLTYDLTKEARERATRCHLACSVLRREASDQSGEYAATISLDYQHVYQQPVPYEIRRREDLVTESEEYSQQLLLNSFSH